MDKLRLFIIEKLKIHPPTTSSTRMATVVATTLGVMFLLQAMVGKLIRPPPHLRHIPHVNYLKFLMMVLIQKKPFGVVSRTLTMPLLRDSTPMYLKPGFLGWTVSIVTPEAAKQFFLNPDIYTKADMTLAKTSLISHYMGTKNILFAHQKEEWKKHRKLVNPAFHKSKPLKTFGLNAHKVFKVVDDANEAPIDVPMLMERYALDVIGQAGFGFDFDSILHQDNEWVNVYNSIKAGLNESLYVFFPWLEKHFLWLFTERQKKHQHVTQFHAMLAGVIENKRRVLQQTYNHKAVVQDNNNDDEEEEEANKDLLTLMLQSQFTGQGTILTDEEIKSNLNVFFLAGHDTTANALSFSLHALARDQHLQKKARDEVLGILGDEPQDVLPTAKDIKQLVYLNQIIKESLRFNGPATSGTPRRVAQDTELMGHFLQKGTPVAVSFYDMHHNPSVFKDPEVYDPDRFALGGEADQIAANRDGGAMAWSPFSNGQRMCIGMQFSLDEQRVMLSCLLRKYEWWLPKGSMHEKDVITSSIGLMTPRNLEIIFKKRY